MVNRILILRLFTITLRASATFKVAKLLCALASLEPSWRSNPYRQIDV